MKRRFAIAMLALLPAIGFAEDAKVEKVRLKTNKGDIVIELNRAKAPVTVENFLSYVKAKHYDGTVFHRVMDGFMIQGGGFAKEGEKLVEKKTKAPIKNESNNGLGNEPYTIAMARTSAPDSATAQFFINVKNNAPLNYSSTGGYAVFGKVVAGTEVVDAIKKVPTGIKTLAMRDDASGQIINQPAENVPTENVVIESATVE